MRVSVAAEVARNYFELRGLQQQLAVAERSLANQRETLRLTTVRRDAGHRRGAGRGERGGARAGDRGEHAAAAGGASAARASPGGADGARARARWASICRRAPYPPLGARRCAIGEPDVAPAAAARRARRRAAAGGGNRARGRRGRGAVSRASRSPASSVCWPGRGNLFGNARLARRGR